MDDKIKSALSKLDTKNDAHWTDAGLPSVDVVRGIAGNMEITRKQIGAAWPGFNRTNASAAPSNPENVRSQSADETGNLDGDEGSETKVTLVHKNDGSQPVKPEAGALDPIEKMVDPASVGLSYGDPALASPTEQATTSPYSADQRELERAGALDEKRAEVSSLPTVDEIVKHIPDPILLLEAVAILASSDQYRRNGPLAQLVRHFSIDQVNIKDHQARTNLRNQQRAEASEAAVAAEAKKA